MMIVPSYVPGIHSSAQGVLLPFSVKVMRSEEISDRDNNVSVT